MNKYLDYYGLDDVISRIKKMIFTNVAFATNSVIKREDVVLYSTQWANNYQIVECNGVFSNEDRQLIIPIPNKDSEELYYQNGIECISQGENALTFKAKTSPISPVYLSIVIFNFKAETNNLSDPLSVYKTTRPKDWIEMPKPENDELYLLFHVPNGLSSLLAFTVRCDGQYTIETGSVINGKFISKVETEEKINSDERYQIELNSNDYPDNNITTDGMKQIIIKISGLNISSWTPSVHDKKDNLSNYINWNIVEIAGRLPKSKTISCASLGVLRYFSLYGSNSITNMNSMFEHCRSLITVCQLNSKLVNSMQSMFSNCHSLIMLTKLHTESVTNMQNMFNNCYQLSEIFDFDTNLVVNTQNMFNNCYSLITIPKLNTGKVNNMVNMFSNCRSLSAIPELNTEAAIDMTSIFNNCYSLVTIPQLNTGAVSNMQNMFNNCYSLTTVPQLNTEAVTNMQNMFNNCSSLISIPKLSTEKVSNMENAFNGCPSLSQLVLDSSITNWSGVDFSIENCSFSKEALIALFNSLPTLETEKSLTIAGNPGVIELESFDKEIATNKKWKLIE